MIQIEIAVPGSVVGLLEESSFPNDCPAAWSAIKYAPIKRAGRGFVRLAVLREDPAVDVLEYLESVLDLYESMTPEERAGTDLRTADKFATRLRFEIGSALCEERDRLRAVVDPDPILIARASTRAKQWRYTRPR